MTSKISYIIALLSFCIIAPLSMAQNRHFPQPKPFGIEGVLISENGDTLKFNHTLDSISSARRNGGKLVMPVDTSTTINRPRYMHDPSQLDTMLNTFYSDSICIDSVIPCDSVDIFSQIESDTTIISPFNNETKQLSNNKYDNWLNREASLSNNYQSAERPNSIDHNKIKYNINTSSKITQKVKNADPSKSKLTIAEQNLNNISYVGEADISRRNWLHSYNGSLQFSQAYISPNWYQGGNNNLNMLLNSEYNIKLNEKFHPNLLFETSFKYKLAMNSAPEDTLRSYSISDEIFQINSKFGVRAAKRWFYSIQAQLKTQFFNGYKSNTNDLKAAFLSPGELNVGLGMTYNYANEKKTFTFDASVSPLSYNLKSCINDRMNETDFGIKEGRMFASQFGSSGEGKLKWNISHNIVLSSRLFVFTDYNYFQGDLENTLSFAINKFLSTQINVHLRYDSSTPRVEGSKWHKLQLKEILSFGFAYSF